MTNANYIAGRRLEYLARDELQRQGYTIVRSAGSHGPIDLCAIHGDGVILIQVKKRSGDVSEGVTALQAVSVPAGVRREVWQRAHGGWRMATV